MMNEPCRLVAAGTDSDADLQADVDNAKCTASLRLQVYQWQDYYSNAK